MSIQAVSPESILGGAGGAGAEVSSAAGWSGKTSWAKDVVQVNSSAAARTSRMTAFTTRRCGMAAPSYDVGKCVDTVVVSYPTSLSGHTLDVGRAVSVPTTDSDLFVGEGLELSNIPT
ncbi:protein of unknown function [Candidatus Methylomirabilis oxygeniifera]|uniref:Uncharacterized protein n=1 Tax=Methylomirabilis oxygeniifera TaxID=671143 RepID=D5MG59_METO1|nr:protein of unknown function [Candidatus Methylomirabilis oxyfera]